MTHEEIKILISVYIDGETTPSEKNIVEEHLKECPACQKDVQMYKAMSSSLSKWSDETLSPDEEIKVQRRFEQRRAPMFTNRTIMALGTTLALTIIVGSVVQTYVKRGIQGRLKSAADNIAEQYSIGNTNQLKAPNYEQSKIYPNQLAMNEHRSFWASDNEAINQKAAKVTAQDEPYNLQRGYTADRAIFSGTAGLDFVGGNVIRKDVLRTAAIDGMEKKEVDSFNGTISNIAPAMPSEIDRKIIKNADITLKVHDAQKAQTQLESLVAKFNGIVTNFNINQLDDGSRKGVLVFSVLPDDLDNVLRVIRTLGEVQSENQLGSDVTNQFTYLQTRLGNYKALRERLKKVLAKNTNNVDNNLTLEGEIASAESNINALESNIKQLDEQSYRATVSVNFYDTNKTVVPEIGFKDKMFANFNNKLKDTAQTCLEIGINTFNGIVIILSFLVPVIVWSLIFWGIYLIVRKFIK